MKIVAISDTHMRHNSIKAFKDVDDIGQPKEPLGGDIIIHAGDALNSGSRYEFESFVGWYKELDFSVRCYIPGNHDWFTEQNEEEARAMCTAAGIIFLNDESFTINGIHIYGMGSSPWFCNWSRNRARNQAEADLRHIKMMKTFTDKVPVGTNIFVSHGPAYGILDEVFRVNGDRYTPPRFVGCEDTLEAIKRVRPEYHICGHVHGSHGESNIDGTTHLNVSICDEIYHPSYEPTIIDWDDK